jgi:kinesin family protein 2/24
MVLRDSFQSSDLIKIVMIACICPGSSSSDHTLNTLRYAERLKEKAQHTQLGEQKDLDSELRLFQKQHSLKAIGPQNAPMPLKR